MNLKIFKKSFFALTFLLGLWTIPINSQTIALWLFDESTGLYPSHAIDDSSPNDYPLVLGRGGAMVKGKFGNALEPLEYESLNIPEGDIKFGFANMPIPVGRTAEPMNWRNAFFAALMTSGENHLRKQVGFANALETDLNIGNFDWTIEFWLQVNKSSNHSGVVFEIGRGPLREKCAYTRLSLNRSQTGFIFENTPTKTKINIQSGRRSHLKKGWHHYTFTYDASRKVLKHFLDGKLVDSEKVNLTKLQASEAAYFSLARSGKWEQPLPAKLDELHFYKGLKYTKNFTPPASYATYQPPVTLLKTRDLLFKSPTNAPLDLSDRKHLFIDDALLTDYDDDIIFSVNPPKKAEQVIGNIQGPFRKHLTVLEDEDGLIRLYNSLEKDYLAVHTSKDGIHFTAPNLGTTHLGRTNIVIPAINGGMGTPFIDPNGPPETRWKYISDYNRRGVYLYTSPDGYEWTRSKTAILPFRSGSQSCTFYDDQRQEYIGYHRTDMQATSGGATLRGRVLTQMKDINQPFEYRKLSQKAYLAAGDSLILREPQPWFLDNGPLTPGGFGLEFPMRFNPASEDPIATDIYVSKAQKYPWASDTYFAFPIVYFHYEEDGPPTRQTLMDKKRGRGSGPLETQLAVSRDGINWKRKPRPTYVGIGPHARHQVVTVYLAHGMIKRGDEIWQYYFGEDYYHSPWNTAPEKRGVYRVIQRLDGFVSMDSPYEKEVEAKTKLFTFKGNSLHLNIDTDAAGYAQVGFLDEQGNPIKGFSVEDCVYINGDFIDTEVEWLRGKDISHLQGKPVRLIFRMRGSKLYAMQFRED